MAYQGIYYFSDLTLKTSILTFMLVIDVTNKTFKEAIRRTLARPFVESRLFGWCSCWNG
jgi:phage-related holin